MRFSATSLCTYSGQPQSSAPKSKPSPNWNVASQCGVVAFVVKSHLAYKKLIAQLGCGMGLDGSKNRKTERNAKVIKGVGFRKYRMYFVRIDYRAFSFTEYYFFFADGQFCLSAFNYKNLTVVVVVSGGYNSILKIARPCDSEADRRRYRGKSSSVAIVIQNNHPFYKNYSILLSKSQYSENNWSKRMLRDFCECEIIKVEKGKGGHICQTNYTVTTE